MPDRLLGRSAGLLLLATILTSCGVGQVAEQPVSTTPRTVTGLTLGQDDLHTAIMRLGKAEAMRCPEYEHGPNCVCYRVVTATDELLLVLEAGALGGWSTLTKYRVIPLAHHAEHPACREAVSTSLGTLGTQLSIGMKRAALGELFEEANTDQGNKVIVEREDRPTDADFFIHERLEVSIQNNSVISFTVEYTESS